MAQELRVTDILVDEDHDLRSGLTR
jgi:hypothetical protein